MYQDSFRPTDSWSFFLFLEGIVLQCGSVYNKWSIVATHMAKHGSIRISVTVSLLCLNLSLKIMYHQPNVAELLF